MSRRLRRPMLVLAMSAIMVGAAVAPATAANDSGKGYANGAFKSTGTGSFVVAAGTAAQAAPITIPASEHHIGVTIFGYEGGPSEGVVYCGDVWNVIVTVAFGFPEEKWLFDGLFTTHHLDGDLVGATSETAVRANQGFLGERGWTQAFGTFIPPGSLDDGTHTVKQVLEHEQFGVFWDPPPLVFEVDDSAC